VSSALPGGDIPAEIADALNRSAALGLITSWRFFPGRGIVVIDGAMHELVYRTWAAAEALTGLLEGVETALRTGKVKNGGGEGAKLAAVAALCRDSARTVTPEDILRIISSEEEARR
jgi:hypothetical protein